MFQLRMFSATKSLSGKNAKQNSVHPGVGGYLCSYPFDSDDDLRYSGKPQLAPLKTYLPPSQKASELSTIPFVDQDKGPRISRNIYSLNFAKTNKYENGFRESGGLKNQTIQEMEDNAMRKAKETTKKLNTCLKIAKGIREGATKTLVLMHKQGEHITKTHTVAADIDIDLSRGERLLGSLGGFFSKTWKPTKSRKITGPAITRDDPVRRKSYHLEQRERLRLTSLQKTPSNTRTSPDKLTNSLQKFELEKEKQDDALSDLSNLLEELKIMAIDMGSEIARQNKVFDPFMDDVQELNFRIRGANQQGRRLLGK